ncbi:NmrA family NAD(P)-binding protein [Rhizobium sp. LC145]|uniref:NmrA family NAD(P)-binding protein n=1 Tax=Rhizobium sp. LC145 TaxID=1120688 RepID=UPI00062A0FA0|nr:NmrA family NAD(P)-binding protein [Rhizobium sp. LC145]KKX34123.1 NmrA family transcriptional regulator [Rhizobium sp. LC145]TKT66905.1 NAD-dependent epimerase/dehydratase family protein [Rhizobiaceae bacterium LC148]
MHIILGGTGHVGSVAAETLLSRGEPVTIVARHPEKADRLRRKGAEIAAADVHDTEALRKILRKGGRLYALNPPAPPSSDTDAEEKATIASILAAIEGSGLEKVVGHSTYGAQKGEGIGDLGTLYGLEEGLKRQPIPASILRAAYYMSNWDFALEAARAEGVLNTFFPEDHRLPMVAPQDLGEAAADLMMEPAEQARLLHVEGPEHYCPADVAAAFAEVLGRPVRTVTTPREEWERAYRALGFSDAAVKSYAGMTGLTLDAPMRPANGVRRGRMTLRDYVRGLVSPG